MTVFIAYLGTSTSRTSIIQYIEYFIIKISMLLITQVFIIVCKEKKCKILLNFLMTRTCKHSKIVYLCVWIIEITTKKYISIVLVQFILLRIWHLKSWRKVLLHVWWGKKKYSYSSMFTCIIVIDSYEDESIKYVLKAVLKRN